MMLKKSLATYREILNTHTPTEGNIRIPAFYQCYGSYFNITDKKSNVFYQNLIKQKIELPYQEDICRKLFQNDVNNIDFRRVYTTKIKMCPDSKEAQFNYKLLHLILPCLTNLKNWRIVNDSLCPLCFVKHNVVHLPFWCTKDPICLEFSEFKTKYKSVTV